MRQWAFSTHWRACAVMAQIQGSLGSSGWGPWKRCCPSGYGQGITTLPRGGAEDAPIPKVAGVPSLQGTLRGFGNPFRAGTVSP